MGGSGSKRPAHTLLRETLCDHDQAINCMAIACDGSLIATGSDDNTIRLWASKTNNSECLAILRGHTSYITCVTFVDSYVISGSEDNTIRKWDSCSCDCMVVYRGHERRITRLIADDKFIISGSFDCTIKVWSFDADDEGPNYNAPALRTFKGHSLGISAIIFIPGGDREEDDEEGAPLFHPEDLLITSSTDSTARSWSVQEEKMRTLFRGHTGPIACMTIDDEAALLFTGSVDTTIRCWDVASGNQLRVLKGHTGAILSLSSVNRLLYSGSADNTSMCWVREFDVPGITYKGHLHTVSYILFNRGYRSGDACVRCYDARSGVLKAVFKGHTSAITCFCILDDYLYTGSTDGTLRSWDVSRATLESEEQLEAIDDEDECPKNNNPDKQEHMFNGYADTKDDVDIKSEGAFLKPPSASPSGRSRLAPSPSPSARSRLAPSPSPSARSKLVASPTLSIKSDYDDDDSVAQLTQDLGL